MSDRENYTLEDIELEALSLQFDILSNSSDTKEKEVVPVPVSVPTPPDSSVPPIIVEEEKKVEILTKLEDKLNNFFVEIHPTNYDKLNFTDLIVKIKSITPNTLSDGISNSSIGTYYKIDERRPRAGFSISALINGENWSIYERDLEYYQIKEEFISKSDYILQSVIGNANINITGERENEILLRNKPLYDALNCVFDKTGWDYVIQSVAQYRIYIHYPEINVKSSDGVSERLLKNVFVILSFLDNKLSQFGMFKTTYYDDELTPASSGFEFFRHPHIQKINTSSLVTHFKKSVHAIGDFCLGSGTGISTLFTKLCSAKRNEDEYIEFLFSIKPYLEWESLEGVPYHKLRDIKKVSRVRRRLSEIFTYPIGPAIHEIIKKDTDIKLYYGDKIRIMKDTGFYNFMDKKFPTLKTIVEFSELDDRVSISTNSDYSSQCLSLIKSANRGEIPSFKFNNQVFNLEIINKEESTHIPVIPDQIITNYIHKIENVING